MTDTPMSRHAPEPWYKQGPLTDEECGRAGGSPPNIVCCREGETEHVAEFEYTHDRDRAVACVNACAGLADPEARMREVFEELDRGVVSTKSIKLARRWLDAHKETK